MVRSKRSRKRSSQSQEHQREELVWRKVDLHLHTPASADYQQPETTFLDILRRAEERELDIIAFTDHNSVAGYARMWRIIEDLELLEHLERINDSEAHELAEYRRLLNKILVLPGFEFTATFGFHILGLFPPETSIRKLEYVLLALNVPEDKLDIGSSEVGATTDVLRCYEVLRENGAIVIGAHVNSTHGIAMQGFPFGKQTKMDYTQDPNLHALEATDLENPGRRTTLRFFSGTKAEYPRRMHCIQGSDAHRLTKDPDRETNLGVGDRPTEMALAQPSFEAIRELLESSSFDHIRPARPATIGAEFIREARKQGDTVSQSFHERLATRRTKSNSVLKDITALANTDGGTLFIGLKAAEDAPIAGVSKPDNTLERLAEDVQNYISPSLDISADSFEIDGKSVIVMSIPEGSEKPYTLGSGEIYVRRGDKTSIASRDDIVEMVLSSTMDTDDSSSSQSQKSSSSAGSSAANTQGSNGRKPDIPKDNVPRPGTGVELIETDKRDGETFYTVYDLRNEKVVPNVTRSSSRSLWRYAITQEEDTTFNPKKVEWNGKFGVIGRRKQGNVHRFDLVYSENDKHHIFYGVTLKGLSKDWNQVIQNSSFAPGDS
ncbi:MAG: transcriptional regulator [Sphaerobacteraceae bacterium]|nr:MAG: transcriptional regulator [Sphaerobacteraceae bacterium]